MFNFPRHILLWQRSLSQVYYCPISNRQFFAVLKLPDASLRVSPRLAKRLRRVLPASRKSPRTTANGGRLIGNDMHSPASATALQCATSIFLIGNEFRFAECEFSAHFRATAKAASSRRTPKKKSPTLTNRAWGNPANEEQYLRRSGPACPPRRASAGRLKPRQKSVADSSSYRALHPRERFRPARILSFAFRSLARRCFLCFAAFGLTSSVLPGHGFSRAERQYRCDSSYRALHPRERFRPAWIWTRFLRSTFAFRVSSFGFCG